MICILHSTKRFLTGKFQSKSYSIDESRSALVFNSKIDKRNKNSSSSKFYYTGF